MTYTAEELAFDCNFMADVLEDQALGKKAPIPPAEFKITLCKAATLLRATSTALTQARLEGRNDGLEEAALLNEIPFEKDVDGLWSWRDDLSRSQTQFCINMIEAILGHRAKAIRAIKALIKQPEKI